MTSKPLARRKTAPGRNFLVLGSMPVPAAVVRTMLVIAAVAVVLVVLPAVAQACPGCAQGMTGDDEASQRMLAGWFWSIIFMMSMPFLIVGGLGSYLYWMVCRARSRPADAVDSAAAADPADDERPISRPVAVPLGVSTATVGVSAAHGIQPSRG